MRYTPLHRRTEWIPGGNQQKLTNHPGKGGRLLSKIKRVTFSILCLSLLLFSLVVPVQAEQLETKTTTREIMTYSSDSSQDKNNEKTKQQNAEAHQIEEKETNKKRPYGVIPPGGYYDEDSGITYFEGENVIIP